MPSIDMHFKLPGTHSPFSSTLTCTFPTLTLGRWQSVKLHWETERIRSIVHFPGIKATKIVCIYFFSFPYNWKEDDFLLWKASSSTCILDLILICFLKALSSRPSNPSFLLYHFNYHINYGFCYKSFKYKKTNFLTFFYLTFHIEHSAIIFLPTPLH